MSKLMSVNAIISILTTAVLLNCSQPKTVIVAVDEPNTTKSKMDTATFGNGCFWCTEAIFQQLEGVESVESGYSGGHVVNPSYEEVCNKTTGHAEVLRIVYDPKKIKITIPPYRPFSLNFLYSFNFGHFLDNNSS